MSKMVKTGTFKPRSWDNQGTVYCMNLINLCYGKEFIRKYCKLTEICSKTLIHRTLFIPVEKKSCDGSLEPSELLELFGTLSNRVLVTR